jgi:hypothetical protein
MVIGVVYSLAIAYIDQLEVEGHPSDTMDNMGRIVSILLWPVLSFIVIRTIIISLKGEQ